MFTLFYIQLHTTTVYTFSSPFRRVVLPAGTSRTCSPGSPEALVEEAEDGVRVRLREELAQVRLLHLAEVPQRPHPRQDLGHVVARDARDLAQNAQRVPVVDLLRPPPDHHGPVDRGPPARLRYERAVGVNVRLAAAPLEQGEDCRRALGALAPNDPQPGVVAAEDAELRVDVVHPRGVRVVAGGEVEGLGVVELDQQEGQLVHAAELLRLVRQPPRRQRAQQVGEALALDADVAGEQVVAHLQEEGHQLEAVVVEVKRQLARELAHVDDDLRSGPDVRNGRHRQRVGRGRGGDRRDGSTALGRPRLRRGDCEGQRRPQAVAALGQKHALVEGDLQRPQVLLQVLPALQLRLQVAREPVVLEAVPVREHVQPRVPQATGSSPQRAVLLDDAEDLDVGATHHNDGGLDPVEDVGEFLRRAGERQRLVGCLEQLPLHDVFERLAARLRDRHVHNVRPALDPIGHVESERVTAAAPRPRAGHPSPVDRALGLRMSADARRVHSCRIRNRIVAKGRLDRGIRVAGVVALVGLRVRVAAHLVGELCKIGGCNGLGMRRIPAPIYLVVAEVGGGGRRLVTGGTPPRTLGRVPLHGGPHQLRELGAVHVLVQQHPPYVFALLVRFHAHLQAGTRVTAGLVDAGRGQPVDGGAEGGPEPVRVHLGRLHGLRKVEEADGVHVQQLVQEHAEVDDADDRAADVVLGDGDPGLPQRADQRPLHVRRVHDGVHIQLLELLVALPLHLGDEPLQHLDDGAVDLGGALAELEADFEGLRLDAGVAQHAVEGAAAAREDEALAGEERLEREGEVPRLPHGEGAVRHGLDEGHPVPRTQQLHEEGDVVVVRHAVRVHDDHAAHQLRGQLRRQEVDQQDPRRHPKDSSLDVHLLPLLRRDAPVDERHHWHSHAHAVRRLHCAVAGPLDELGEVPRRRRGLVLAQPQHQDEPGAHLDHAPQLNVLEHGRQQVPARLCSLFPVAGRQVEDAVVHAA
ncbi:DNA translocase FtsK [Babesia caballi]|uniref:DNA translocase FtsK n=1 Tax=Babesia caballi TaxID=5871 RepID=A0AAV4LZ51_BABCB|nr:DNA translocase FtsK [Babesia caballi]